MALIHNPNSPFYHTVIVLIDTFSLAKHSGPYLPFLTDRSIHGIGLFLECKEIETRPITHRGILSFGRGC
jgi:hypothetical protein